MTTSNSNSYIYIPADVNTDDVQKLVRSVDRNKTNLLNNYDNKLKEIQNEYYLRRGDDKLLENDLNNELERQKDNEQKEYTKILLQNNKNIQNIVELVNDIKKQKSQMLDNNTNYTSIESLNGQHLSIQNIKNTNDYMIYVNNKCLSVNLDKKYSLEMCDNNSPTQRFTLNPVNDNSSYLSQYNMKAQPTEIISYPYNLVKSKLTGLCLQEQNGSLFMNQCTSLNGQKWKGM